MTNDGQSNILNKCEDSGTIDNTNDNTKIIPSHKNVDQSNFIKKENADKGGCPYAAMMDLPDSPADLTKALENDAKKGVPESQEMKDDVPKGVERITKEDLLKGQEMKENVIEGQEMKAAVIEGQEMKANGIKGQEMKANGIEGQEMKANAIEGQEMKETVIEDKETTQDLASNAENDMNKTSKDDHIELEEIFALETLMQISNNIFINTHHSITKDDINITNCKVVIYESNNSSPDLNEGDDEFINMLFYFQNKNYIFFLIYCLNKKNVVYLKFFNPLLIEKENIEAINLFFINNCFPHIVLGLNNGKICLYNHEGVICMQNKFFDCKIKKIFLEHNNNYILFLHENNTVINSNANLIKRALESNNKIMPIDYIFTVNKNIPISHIILRYNNTLDSINRELYSVFGKDDLAKYVNICTSEKVDESEENANNFNGSGNPSYVIASKNMTWAILNIIKPNTKMDFLIKRECYGTSEKLSSKINNFIKNIFIKDTEPLSNTPTNKIHINNTNQNTLVNINNNNYPIYAFNTNMIYTFNDPKRQIIDICVCPWNNYLALALDNLGRLCLYNISRLSILYMWKSYRSAFMSFILKKDYNQITRNINNDNSTSITNTNIFYVTATDKSCKKGIFFYIKPRNLIEIWDINTLYKIYGIRTFDDPILFKFFFKDHDIPNDVYFFNTNTHVFVINSKFEVLHIKWV
ncbi:Rab3 GTPase-activating protein non-catalytic subunit, putative [Plasmodium chabaudi adami]|uniref:Rab3 GTPase-activating protein non-catalytic subunit, putative n=1 Tax=Plasmodium chabaudi adami TaxID=5826 RepID=A0A1D3S0D5_PLACE|nr:Rab3 GTPase-activating protein non-catalytic subunit, putative [Plasmodium chabaudi adami]